jgi:DNA mismatch endonuclease (patch repair protein)
LRYRVDVAALPGRPDIVFTAARVVIFCDGDFWHGRDLESRSARLAQGHNASYWTAKIRTNVLRDQKRTEELQADGWLVLRYWESDITGDAAAVATDIVAHLTVRCSHTTRAPKARQ